LNGREIWQPSGRRITLRGFRLGQSLGPIIDVVCSFVPVYLEGDLDSGTPGLTEESERRASGSLRRFDHEVAASTHI